MTCNRIVIGLLGLLVGGGCADTMTVTVIGIGRAANHDCVDEERAYTFEIERRSSYPASVPPEWCGVLGEGNDVVCFLHSENGYGRPGVEVARALTHSKVPADHPDLGCWEAELAAWDADYDPDDPGSYHPMWNSDEGSR